ncbi:hypothetical protein V1503_06135 [Bacillus sp. SCS-151]|uniref:hypothetical protein n=1 Tax=Nanhaiella sioensis TaxID=3115293 RepID=UPI0039781F07
MAQTKREVGELTVKLNVEVSDAIIGLKAIKREARKAMQVLRELETNVPPHINKYGEPSCD